MKTLGLNLVMGSLLAFSSGAFAATAEKASTVKCESTFEQIISGQQKNRYSQCHYECVNERDDGSTRYAQCIRDCLARGR